MRGVLVIPCYNEAARITAGPYVEFVKLQRSIDILFVDDGSTDATRRVLTELVDQQPTRFRLLALDRNSGKAEAVRRGLLDALASAPDFIGYWDADLATPLEAVGDFQKVLRTRPECELLLGSRVRLLGRDIQRNGARHYLGRVFATAASLLLNLPVYDTQCGAKVFRVTARTAKLFEDVFMSRWIFDVEILARFLAVCRDEEIALSERAIYEVALRSWRDVAGSKLKTSDFLRSMADLVRIWWTHKRARHSNLASHSRTVGL